MKEERKEVFVFGSNLLGAHGAGAAYEALKRHGAIMYIGEGLQGNSYALPTKDKQIKTLPIEIVEGYVNRFKELAAKRSDLKFKVTQIGCGLAGFTSDQIAPLFVDSPDNCYFDTAWKTWLGKDTNYWGTFNV